MINSAAFNSDRLIEFFEALVKGAPHKMVLILDNLGVHRSRPVKAWLAAHVAQMDVFHLPATALNSTPTNDSMRG